MALALALGRARARPHLAQSGGRRRDCQGWRDRRPRLDPARRPTACRDRGAQAAPARPRTARRFTLRSSLARITARRRPAPTPSSRAGVRRVVSALEDPNPEVAGAGHASLREHGIAVDVGLGAEEARARSCRPYPPHARRPAARPLKLAVSADGKAGLAGRKPVGDHRRGGARRVHLACARRTTPSWSASAPCSPTIRSDLPAAGHGRAVAGAGRARCDLACRSRSRRCATARETPTWVLPSPRRLAHRRGHFEAEGVDVLRVAGRTAGSILLRCSKRLAERGITRLMVEGGPDRCGRVRGPIWWTRRRCSARPNSSAPMASTRWRACRSRADRIAAAEACATSRRRRYAASLRTEL